MVGFLLSLFVGVLVYFSGVDPGPGVDTAGGLTLYILALAAAAIVSSWVFPRTIGLATVGWTVGSAAGLVVAPFAGHPWNMLPMALSLGLSIFVATGIRRAMDQAGMP